MKLKLDENIDLRVVTLLQLAGHDIATVPGQGLSSAPDTEEPKLLMFVGVKIDV
ncbi:DUF5615 family PIN-like protein [Nostoc sp.]|uniref:DUF5615 family PIN-like protein n=1 Tax=Nostoc sp. TaxID=1180 RepID=UPI003FA57F6E